MQNQPKRVELLAPAGNFEKLEIAVHYGADAVYLAGKEFSLRNFCENFSLDQIRSAVKFARRHDVKVYVACNIYARNAELAAIADYLKSLKTIGPDAIIVADPGIFMQVRSIMPQMPIHLSTQANTTNYNSVRFWEKLGVRRINVAREIDLKEIAEIARYSAVEIEAFVHGAMCISYSGRCLLSSFLADRDSNSGKCTQPCRWKYALMEELRPGKYMPISEDDRGSYIFNSKDLCMIEHIPAMIESGINVFKIEGRMKGINYLASTVKVYREAIDAFRQNPVDFRVRKEWIEELETISHRGYCTGLYLGSPQRMLMQYEAKNRIGHTFVGKVVDEMQSLGVNIEVRNKIHQGDIVEVIPPKGPNKRDKILEIKNGYGQSLDFAQPGNRVTLRLQQQYVVNTLIRRVEHASE